MYTARCIYSLPPSLLFPLFSPSFLQAIPTFISFVLSCDSLVLVRIFCVVTRLELSREPCGLTAVYTSKGNDHSLPENPLVTKSSAGRIRAPYEPPDP